ncbi:MAG: NAAT family transporter [Candidatus Omnitrophica bacterium]|nr:NAAT family transporter [Candidatus Omnitrophota bacterium]
MTAFNLTDFAILSFTTLFVIVDPIGLVPTFLAMTASNSLSEKRHMALVATATCAVLLIVFTLAGQAILRALSLTLSAFELAGGMVLTVIALDMLKARRTPIKETPEEKKEGIDKDDIAITPLAVPMLAGPGALTTVILLSSRAENWIYSSVLLLNIILVSVSAYLILRISLSRANLFGVLPMKIATRLMGLFLLAIAAQFLMNALASQIQSSFSLSSSSSSMPSSNSSGSSSLGLGLPGPEPGETESSPDPISLLSSENI